MDSGLWWIFDLVIILLAGYVIYSNAKRGMTKVFVMAIGYIVSTLLASLLSAAAATPLYESVARSSNLVAMEAVNNHIDLVRVFTDALVEGKYGFNVKPEEVKRALSCGEDENFEDILYAYANDRSGSVVSEQSAFNAVLRDAFIKAYSSELNERLPKYVRRNFVEQVTINPAMMRSVVAERFNPQHSDSDNAIMLEDTFSREPCTQVLQIFIYLIIFSILMVISAIVSAILQYKIFFNLHSGPDHILGGLLGILEAGATVILVTFIVYLIIMLSGNSLHIINEETVDGSYIFSFFYRHLKVLL